MQKHLSTADYVLEAVLKRVIWEVDATPSLDLFTRRLSVLVAATPSTGTHMSGTAIDISVLSRATGEELDRGAPYLEMSELTPMLSPFVPHPARRLRAEVTELMAVHGFVAYPYEFWHYNKDDALAKLLARTQEPARYGPVDLRLPEGKVTAIVDARQPLNSPEEIRSRVALAIQRLHLKGRPTA